MKIDKKIKRLSQSFFLSKMLFLGLSVFFLFSGYLFFSEQSFAKVKVSLPAIDVLARVDNYLNYPSGLLKGRLTIIHKTGRTRVYTVDLYKNRDNSLYIFQSKRRGLEKKLLYNEEGEIIWEFDFLSKVLFQKSGSQKYDLVMGSGYSFVDLSFYSLQANYTPNFDGEENFEGKDYVRLKLAPIKQEEYKQVIILVDQDKGFRPVRVDFYDPRGLLVKSMTCQFNRIKVKVSGSSAKKITLNNRKDIIHMTSGTISILEIFKADKTVHPDKSIYRNDNLGK